MMDALLPMLHVLGKSSGVFELCLRRLFTYFSIVYIVTVTAIKCFRKAFRKWMNDMIDEPQLLSGTSRSDDGHGNLHCNKYDDACVQYQ